MAESPAFLSAQDVGSFAYLTIKDRTPQILTKVIDTLHRHKSEFFEKHGEVLKKVPKEELQSALAMTAPLE
ncbi:similar to RIKEN cDNA 1700052N19, isoform CRA_d [Rattus norvegicus]|uniref:Sugar phosphate phosphatase n=1 Tax=Rattus norvegicus TaxID=10116 RepID=A6KIL5_RAT|nr:similar to RIKEN cDNA 1700052N19, isoform CRA_d [Rattus norvegicus]